MATTENPVKNISEEGIKEAIMAQIEALYDEHIEQIQNIRNRAQKKSINVNFSNEIDCSESEPVVNTKIRFCETYTDERTSTVDNAQGTFSIMQNTGRGGRKGDPAPAEPAEGEKNGSK